MTSVNIALGCPEITKDAFWEVYLGLREAFLLSPIRATLVANLPSQAARELEAGQEHIDLLRADDFEWETLNEQYEFEEGEENAEGEDDGDTNEMMFPVFGLNWDEQERLAASKGELMPEVDELLQAELTQVDGGR
ncbi:hypothetical protein CALCODRAFT_507402 [Calocera cornea HHB12733]|uniref:Uncharacterized protein n=1 Tax=Calocera cornea HHB12733 TaxID=1353952 RepID=A0A165HSQ8_9BASI|nr:hypothetical protein CALCODRAFT_507402 [Calocera cornea HHB12733]